MRSFSTQCLHRAQVGEGRVHRDVDVRHVLGLEPQAEVAHGVQRLDVVVVHLPVPAHQRAARGSPPGRVGSQPQGVDAGQVALRLDVGQRRTTAGREEVDLVGEAELLERAVRCRRRRPPRTRGRRATASATMRVPPAKRRSSKAPSGPFHSTVPGAGDHLGEGRRRVGPDVETGPAVGQVALNDLDAPLGPCPAEGGPNVPPGSRAHVSVGSTMRTPEASSAAAVLEVVGVEERAPDLARPGRPGT